MPAPDGGWTSWAQGHHEGAGGTGAGHCTALEVMGVAGRRSSPVILVFVLLNVFYQDVL